VLAQYTKSGKRNNWMRALRTLSEANEFAAANADEDEEEEGFDGVEEDDDEEDDGDRVELK